MSMIHYLKMIWLCILLPCALFAVEDGGIAKNGKGWSITLHDHDGMTVAKVHLKTKNVSAFAAAFQQATKFYFAEMCQPDEGGSLSLKFPPKEVAMDGHSVKINFILVATDRYGSATSANNFMEFGEDGGKWQADFDADDIKAHHDYSFDIDTSACERLQKDKKGNGWSISDGSLSIETSSPESFVKSFKEGVSQYLSRCGCKVATSFGSMKVSSFASKISNGRDAIRFNYSVQPVSIYGVPDSHHYPVEIEILIDSSGKWIAEYGNAMRLCGK